MTFKEKALKAMRETPMAIDMGDEYNRRELIAAVERIPDEAHEDILCTAPNYEEMYHAAQAELMEQKKICENMACELRAMHLNNARLTGYREAVERIFGEGV